MSGRVKSVIGAAAITASLGAGAITLPKDASADENCVSWSQQYGCEAEISCLIVTETHGYRGVYWIAGPNAGGFEMLFF